MFSSTLEEDQLNLGNYYYLDMNLASTWSKHTNMLKYVIFNELPWNCYEQVMVFFLYTDQHAQEVLQLAAIALVSTLYISLRNFN